MREASILDRILQHPLAALLEKHSKGAAIHAVGGVVRDALMSSETTDLDLSIAREGASLAQILARDSGGTFISLGGDRFSSYRVVSGSFQADIWDRRGGTLTADLERRDLTINSIGCPLDGTRLQDPSGGLADLATKTLRATKPDCFDRDPLRVLRLARFRLELEGFEIEAHTRTAARAAAPSLGQIATERIRDELHRVLSFESSRLAFETLGDLGALAVLIPDTSNPSVASALLERADRLDEHLTMLREEFSGPTGAPDAGDAGDAFEIGVPPSTAAGRKLVTLALLFAAERTGAEALVERGLATRRTIQAAIRLLSEPLPFDEEQQRLFLLQHGPRWHSALAVTAAASSQASRSIASIARAIARLAINHPSLVEGVQPLLDGHVAAEILGVEPGPAVGESLRALRRAQALGLVNTREAAEDFLRKRRS